MIEPKLALVRPRVIAERARGTVLLEDLVAEMAAAGDVSGMSVFGRPGFGITTALRHLAAVFQDDSRVSFTDLGNVDRGGEPASCAWIFFREVSKQRQGLLKCDLAGWRCDEWIEYLLAAHKRLCSSVMKRVLSDPYIHLLDGNPTLVRQVLDELAADISLPDTKAAFHRVIDRHFSNSESKQLTAQRCFAELTWTNHSSQTAELMANAGDCNGLPHSLDFPCVRLVLGIEAAWHHLEHVSEVDNVRIKWPRYLITEVAPRVAETPTVQDKLRGWISSKHGALHPLAVSLLTLAKASWQWPRPHLLSLRSGKVNLVGAIVDGVDCTSMALARCSMQGASFEGACLKGVKLTGAKAPHANFQDADLTGATISRFVGKYADFTRADLSSAKGKRVCLSNAIFSFANLSHVRFIKCELSDASFDVANLRQATLTECDFKGARLDDADFRHADLSGSDFFRMNLKVANFRHANFTAAMLCECKMEEMRLPGSDFRQASLDGAIMTGSFMPRANFADACLKGARLAEIDWEEANLRNADLTGATFHMGSSRSGLVGSSIPMLGSRTGFYTDEFNEQDFKAPEEIRKANLRGADLRGARIDHVDFYLVDLRDALYDQHQEEQLRRTGAILETRAC